MFFCPLDIELQRVRLDKNSILIIWFSFRLHLKSRPHSEGWAPRRNTNIIYLSVPELENSVFLDLVLLRFTPVASYSFHCPSWRSSANSSSATLSCQSCTCSWIFLPSGIQSGEETDVGRQLLNRALESLFSFILLVFRTKQGAWHRRIQRMKGSHFPSTRTTKSARLILGSQYAIGNPTLSHVQLCDNHTTNEPVCFGLRQLLNLGSNIMPLWTKFDTQTTVISHRRRKRLSSSAGLLFRSEFSDRRHNTGFGNKSIVFLHFQRKFREGQLRLLSINFDFRNVIFQPMVFPFVSAKYKWKFMRDRCKLSFPLPSRLCRSLARFCPDRFARPNRRACSQARLRWIATTLHVHNAIL